MTSEGVYALLLNRGHRLTIDEGGKLVVDPGDKMPITGTLDRVIALHHDRLKRLVACNWRPDIKGEPKGSGLKRYFDDEAEEMVRQLYQIDYGLRWDGQTIRVFPQLANKAVSDWWNNRASKIWDRVVEHLKPRGYDDKLQIIEFRHRDHGKEFKWTQTLPIKVPGKGVEKEYVPRIYIPNEVWFREVEARHVFESEPCVVFDAWRYPGEPRWRLLWGRYVEPYPRARLEWRPWGHR